MQPDDEDHSPNDRTLRRASFAADVTLITGIDEMMIDRLVHAFCARIRTDVILGPIFAPRMQDWEPHLARMCAFWSSVVLMSGRCHGRPMPAHASLPVDASHFDRWPGLFESTARENCLVQAAEHFIAEARLIAQSLELGVAGYHGQMLAPGERLSPEAG